MVVSVWATSASISRDSNALAPPAVRRRAALVRYSYAKVPVPVSRVSETRDPGILLVVLEGLVLIAPRGPLAYSLSSKGQGCLA